MSVPRNSHDYQRFLQLAEIIMRCCDDGTISVYTGENGYCHIEMQTKQLPQDELAEVFKP